MNNERVKNEYIVCVCIWYAKKKDYPEIQVFFSVKGLDRFLFIHLFI